MPAERQWRQRLPIIFASSCSFIHIAVASEDATDATFTKQWMRREPLPTTTGAVLASDGSIQFPQDRWMRKEPSPRSTLPSDVTNQSFTGHWMRRELPSPMMHVSLASDGTIEVPRERWMRREFPPIGGPSTTSAVRDAAATGQWMRREPPPMGIAIARAGAGANMTFTNQWMRREPPPMTSVSLTSDGKKWIRREPSPPTRLALASDGTIEMSSGKWMRREPLPMGISMARAGAGANMTFTNQKMRREPSPITSVSLTSNGEVELPPQKLLRPDPPPMDVSLMIDGTNTTFTNQWMRREPAPPEMRVSLASDGTVAMTEGNQVRRGVPAVPTASATVGETAQLPAKKHMRRESPAPPIRDGAAKTSEETQSSSEPPQRGAFRSGGGAPQAAERLQLKESSGADVDVRAEPARQAPTKKLTRRESKGS